MDLIIMIIAFAAGYLSSVRWYLLGFVMATANVLLNWSLFMAQVTPPWPFNLPILNLFWMPSQALAITDLIVSFIITALVCSILAWVGARIRGNRKAEVNL